MNGDGFSDIIVGLPGFSSSSPTAYGFILILQDLSSSSDGAAVTWMRSSASPETQRVTFELPTDGVTYTPLGVGTRISGGWTLDGFLL